MALFHLMVADTSPEPVSLGELLAGVARRASCRDLRAMMIIGTFGAAAIAALVRGGGWFGAAGALAVGAYGAWGIADQKLARLWAQPGAPRVPVFAWRIARGLAALVAGLAGVTFLASMFIPVIGKWTS